MGTGYLFCVAIGLLSPFVVSKHVQFYRKDYTYMEDFDAFYKVHWDLNGISWSNAFKACDDEAATLFYPKGEEWKVVKKLTDAMPNAVSLNSSEIFVGLHDLFGVGEFITVDGHATETPLKAEDKNKNLLDRCVMMDITTGAFRVSEFHRTDPAPFVCKNTESCPTIDHEYKYFKNVKKCYKVNTRPMTWHAAMQTCFMEGGILAVLDNISDVRDLIKRNKDYYIGFRKMFDASDFYTVNGQKFENALFKRWYLPDNSDYRYKECGTIKYDRDNNRDETTIIDHVEAANCQKELPFICEMAARS